MAWSRASTGVVALPSGVLVRGRRLVDVTEPADLTLVLGRGVAPAWAYRRLRWPDFWVPLDREDALEALRDAHASARSGQRVEVACRGGVGRTGTALSALAVLDGLTPDDAVTWVRERYHRRAVETPWQRRWLRRMPLDS
jgi:Protein-tyrosine phosphatase